MEVSGEAPVPPSKPAIVTWSERALATPAATVPTPTSETSFTDTSASGLTFFRSKISCARSSIEQMSWCGGGGDSRAPCGRLAALAVVPLAADPVHGDRERGVGLARDRAERHGAGREALDDLGRGLD